MDDNKNLPRPRRIFDDPEVKVFANDIEKALKRLRIRTQKYGTLKALATRRKYPAKTDRARRKRLIASKRFLRREKLKRIYER
jgi:ribosomal protein S21